MGLSFNDFSVQRKVKVCATYLARSLNHQQKLSALAGWSALHYAAKWGSIEIVALIFGRVQSPDPLTLSNSTPLEIACEHNSPDVGKQKPENFTFTRRPYRKTSILLHFRCP